MKGGRLLLILIFGLILFDLGRSFLPVEEGPALFMAEAEQGLIQLEGLGAGVDGIHQINDAEGIFSVINLAGLRVSDSVKADIRRAFPLESGKLMEFQLVNGRVVGMESSWMAASLRMTLGIPLRVERMTVADWQDLPGAGPQLAARIEMFRQKNGGIGDFSRLREVPGIGDRLMKRWSPFFLSI